MKTQDKDLQSQNNFEKGIDPVGAMHSNEMDTGGASLNPPPFQLKTDDESGINPFGGGNHRSNDDVQPHLGKVSAPIQAKMATKGPANVVQMASINDYADRNNPAHDPSRLSDTQIRATDEYIEMARAHYYIPTTDPSILYSLEEITLATRLALRSIREGNSFTVASNGQTFLDRAKEQLGTVRHIEGQANNLHWSAFSSQDAATNPSVLQSQYAKWILLNQPEPNPNSGIMNCWEMVMYGAYRAGYVTVSRLRQIYLTANSSFVTRYNHIVDQVRNHGADPNSFTFPSFGDTFESEIRASSEYIFDPSNSNSPSPLPGDIVIFNRAAGHAAISTGTVNSNGQHEIMSLWTQNRGRIVRTTIEALLADGAGTPVKFWSARW